MLPFRWIVITATFCMMLGCASHRESLPDQEEPPNEKEIAYKWALYTTPQLEQLRDELAEELGRSKLLIAPAPIVLVAVIDTKAKKNKLSEIKTELARRRAEGGRR